MGFGHFFVDRPIFASVISIVITMIGAIALFYLPIAQYPRIAPPGVSITINYPGASAKVVADTVRVRTMFTPRLLTLYRDGLAGGEVSGLVDDRRAGNAVHVVANGERRVLYAHRYV